MQIFKNLLSWVKLFLILTASGVAGIGGYVGLKPLVDKEAQKLLPESPKPVDSELQKINFTVQEKLAPNLISNVDVQILSDGPPTSKKTDSNGYLEIEIPTRKTVTIILKKKGYNSETYLVNLQTDPKTTRTFYIEREESLSSSTSSPQEPPNNSGSSTPLVSSSSSTSTLPNKYVGSWIGNLNQKNSTDNSSTQVNVEIVFQTGNVGSKVATTDYSSRYCHGVLVLRSANQNSIELLETITIGSCAGNATIKIKRLGDDFLEFKSTAPNSPLLISGNITRK
ncbi:MAG: hypothetical protein V7K38_14825 [Nostoc sp.]|uniref:hypothetical protein n=1 Tax=Nostoc sp. TaxID=1180 RepID=UPI002FF810DE